MEGFLFALTFAAIVVIALLYGVFAAKGKRGGAISTAKFPPPFSSSLSSKEVLAAVEARLQTIQSIRAKWKTTEKVEKVGRLQSMLTVPYNLAGDNIRISFLMNLLATNKDAGGCTVEWNYVMMSPISSTPPEIALLEDEIYKITTLETRAALFVAQGDSEEASYLQAKTATHHKEIELPPAPEEQKRAPQQLENSPKRNEELFEDSHAQKQEAETAITVANNIPDTPLPDIVGEVLKVATVGTTSEQSLASIPNTLNFSPPDPALSSATSAPGEKCVKCSQARDPAFSFCLYCGHADA